MVDFLTHHLLVYGYRREDETSLYFMFLPLSALSCSEDIWVGLLARSHCWLDSGQWRPYWLLLGACGQYCYSTYTPSLVSFRFCYRLILFECENKCESVYMLLHWCSSVQTLYSGEGCLGPDHQCPLWWGHCVPCTSHQEWVWWVDQAI